jgi:hypothetical protein
MVVGLPSVESIEESEEGITCFITLLLGPSKG